ncbi:MAG: 6-bladed beta-propeller [Phycisphaerales bacterium]
MKRAWHTFRHTCPAMLLGVILLPFIHGCAGSAKVAETKRYAFWPAYPDEPHIQYLTSFDKASDVTPAKSQMDQLIYGKEQQTDLPISKPYGIDMADGKIYVCDLRNDCVTILDLRHKQTLVMGATGAERLHNPCDIAITPDRYKYVADLGRGAVAVFDPQDRFVTSFVIKDLKPTSLAVRNNELYVCDFNGQNVLVLDRRDGRLLRKIGGPGPNPGQFVRPLGVDVDQQGNVYVVDVMQCRLSKFDPSGNLVSTIGTISNNVGGLVRPKHIAADRDGILFVVDASFQNVQLFNDVGQVYTFFGGPGNHPGAMYLPAGIAIHDGDFDLFQQYIHPAFEVERLILVTNQFGSHKVAVYAYGHLKPGKTVADIASSKGVVPIEDAPAAPAPGAPGIPGKPAPLPSDAVAPGSGSGPATSPGVPDGKAVESAPVNPPADTTAPSDK